MNVFEKFKICEDLKDWKSIFYKYISGDINLLDLEKKIYEKQDLEEKLGRDKFIQLFSFNFKENSIEDELISFLKEEIIDDSVYNKWLLCKLFKEAGWDCSLYKIPDNPLDIFLPDLFLKIYGGLEIGEVGSGIEQAKSNISFLLKPIDSDLDENWAEIIGPVVQIGFAHHEHIILFMNTDGMFYLYMDSIDKMYLGGDFEETVSKLLFGLDYGTSITSRIDSR